MMARGSGKRQQVRWSRKVAAALAGLYIALALSASYCQLAHAAGTPGTHHHAPKVAHSVLCAWACQAVSTVLAGQPDVAGAPTLAVLCLLSLWSMVWTCRPVTLFSARAPPVP